MERKKIILSSNKYAIFSIVALGISLIVLAGSILFWIRAPRTGIYPGGPNLTEITVKTPEGTREKIIPDEYTTVWINSNATLEYDAAYKRNRNMHLAGEACFRVRNTEDIFKVVSSQVTVEAINATFRLESIPGKEHIRITLYDGEATLKAPGLSGDLVMTPGTDLILNPTTGRMEMHRVRVGVRGPEWIVNKFEYLALNSILYSIADYYDVSLVNNHPGLSQELYSFVFEGDKTLEEVMNVVKTISGKIDYRLQGRQLVIY